MSPLPKWFIGSASLVTAILLGACAPTTRLASSWVDPTQVGHDYRKISVLGATSQPTLRRQYESAFAAELAKRGTSAVASFTLLGEGLADQAAATSRFKDNGVDAVIVTRLVDRESYHAYVPSHSAAPHAPADASSGWYGFYSMGFGYERASRDSAANQVYHLESRLYDLASDGLVWSGITETVLQPGDRSDDEIRPIIGELLTGMQKSQVLTTSKP